MIICLYGPDDYRRLQKKNEIVREFQKKNSALARDAFDFEEKDGAERCLEFLRSQSIFGEPKLVILEHAFEMEAGTLAKLLKPLAAEKTVTVLISENTKPVKTLAFLLEKPSLSQKFEKLEAAEQSVFITAEAKKRGMALGASAARFLGEVYGGDTWALVTELQKLSALAPSLDKKIIEKKDLAALDLETAPNYWALLNGLKSYDMKQRLSALEALFAINDPAAKIFNIMAAQAGEKIPRMAEYDLAVKSGKLDYEEVLVDLAIS